MQGGAYELALRDLARSVEDQVYGFLADYQFDPSIDRASLVATITSHLTDSFVRAPEGGMIAL